MHRTMILSVALIFSACTCEDDRDESLDNQIVTSKWSGKDERIDKLTKGLKKLAVAVKQAEQVKTGPLVHWEALGRFTPKEIPSFELRGSREGGFETVGEAKIARARARYASGEQRLDIVITDTTNAPALRAGVIVSKGVDEKTKEHTTRGMEIDKYPALVQWRAGTKEGQVTALVGDRYVVEARMRPVDSSDAVVDIVKQLELNELAALEGPLATDKKAEAEAPPAATDKKAEAETPPPGN